MQIAILDYGSGNLRSAAKAVERAAREAGISAAVHVTDDPALVRAADRVILPGVGAFGDCAAGLAAVEGLRDALIARVMGDGVPFLGVCVGMQLMATRGLEHGSHDGLDWIAGEVRALTPADPALKIPHMGWNTLRLRSAHPILDGIADGDHAYFVHSYHLVPESRACVLAETDYGGPVTAIVGRDNLVGTQFHPEKSQVTGLRLIANFLRWRP
ncbi:imidazole glycerol phosphate synthase subunit HisH [Futiania mangrovi]|uniref:Imidazole glycerol phosphate synthase subunit HisH n=1 Tax=Futiania mangrovi TaxID=2959716 RepID=A0A9J6PIV3_9PROT|nr:imidazole glycerol phosphate synthase subunit HisH [Futiania mangrovii]MCP1336479.1 imidazole glycerol phosphate synthase subunit HisH [Futiania mangrovii]